MDENQPRLKNQKIELRTPDERYTFDVQYKKPVHLGPVEVVQVWMDPKTIYCQRRGKKPPAHNHQELLRCFWDTVVARGDSDNREAQEKYLHAALAPFVHSNLSRDAFDDAFPRNWHPQERNQLPPIEQLEEMLQSSTEKSMVLGEFQRQAGCQLKKQDFREGFDQKHEEIDAELFDEPCRLLGRGTSRAALEELVARFRKVSNDCFPQRRIKDPVGHEVLQALAYESRAAMNSIHSLVWEMMISTLQANGQIDTSTEMFLRLWHCDWLRSDDLGSLFHGSLFGTHPATHLFMQTETGPKLLGAWLQSTCELRTARRQVATAVAPLSQPGTTDSTPLWLPGNEDEHSLGLFERFLHGVSVAIGVYKSHLEQSRQAGKQKQRSQSKSKQPVMVGAVSAQSTNAKDTREAAPAPETFDRDEPYKCAVIFPHDRGLTKDGNVDDIRQAIESQLQRMGYTWKVAHVLGARTSGPRNMKRLRKQLSDARESFDLLLIDANNALVESADDTAATLEELGVQVVLPENYL